MANNEKRVEDLKGTGYYQAIDIPPAPAPTTNNTCMSKQLTSLKACQQKHTYYSQAAGTRARKRRNKAAGVDYLRSYKCNVCGFWHVTSQKKDKEGVN